MSGLEGAATVQSSIASSRVVEEAAEQLVLSQDLLKRAA